MICSVVGAGGMRRRSACTDSSAPVSRTGFRNVAASSPRRGCSSIGCPGRGGSSATAGRARPLLLDRLEHGGHRARVVAGGRHDLRAEDVGLLLVLAAVAQERRAEAELRALRDDAAGGAADDRADDRARQGADLVGWALLACAVP